MIEQETEQEDEALMRSLVLPEEDLLNYPPAYRGYRLYRWFRSPNVVCLDQYRRRKRERANSITPAPAA